MYYRSRLIYSFHGHVIDICVLLFVFYLRLPVRRSENHLICGSILIMLIRRAELHMGCLGADIFGGGGGGGLSQYRPGH